MPNFPTIKRDENGQIILTSKDMYLLFDINDTTLNNWVHKGMPKLTHGHFRLQDVIRWRGVAKVEDNMSDNARKLQADADYKKAKAQQEEVRLKEMLGELVDVEIVKGELGTVFTTIRQILLKLPNEIRVHVHTLYPESDIGVSEIAEATVRKCLDELSNCHYSTTEREMEETPTSDD